MGWIASFSRPDELLTTAYKQKTSKWKTGVESGRGVMRPAAIYGQSFAATRVREARLTHSVRRSRQDCVPSLPPPLSPLHWPPSWSLMAPDSELGGFPP